MDLPLEDRIASIREQFPAVTSTGFFNPGTVSPPPKHVLERRHARESEFYFGGPLDPAIKERLRVEFDAVRGKLGAVIGAGAGSIALAENTTAGINAALLSQDWQSGDEIITTDAEHPAVMVPLRWLAQVNGIAIRMIAAADPARMPEIAAGLVGPRTRALVMSHVSFSTGGAFPVEAICAAMVRTPRVVTIIDGAQSVGAIPVDVKASGVDFYAFPGYKYTLGFEGTGALYVSDRALAMSPYRVGSHSVAQTLPDGTLRLHADARRFEGTATTDVQDYVAWGDSVDYLTELGLANVYGRVAALCGRFRQGLANLPRVTMVTPAAAEHAAALIVFRVAGMTPREVCDRLLELGMIIRTVPGDAVRASFHFYHTPAEVAALLDGLATITAQ